MKKWNYDNLINLPASRNHSLCPTNLLHMWSNCLFLRDCCVGFSNSLLDLILKKMTLESKSHFFTTQFFSWPNFYCQIIYIKRLRQIEREYLNMIEERDREKGIPPTVILHPRRIPYSFVVSFEVKKQQKSQNHNDLFLYHLLSIFLSLIQLYQ